MFNQGHALAYTQTAKKAYTVLSRGTRHNYIWYSELESILTGKAPTSDALVDYASQKNKYTQQIIDNCRNFELSAKSVIGNPIEHEIVDLLRESNHPLTESAARHIEELRDEVGLLKRLLHRKNIDLETVEKRSIQQQGVIDTLLREQASSARTYVQKKGR